MKPISIIILSAAIIISFSMLAFGIKEAGRFLSEAKDRETIANLCGRNNGGYFHDDEVYTYITCKNYPLSDTN